ncbi:amino acid ABC transporter substrate-binding protein [Chakrabartyella piscis]|uniref:amino acid ABC transporter substrate-binding protein n=1 Tax=Chakrabartyella piscis TaxID=2918914 RepID=UPI002958BEBD|nr:amino acid ABC transporter substrate-binding protein [Chakrabartyella piscis]
MKKYLAIVLAMVVSVGALAGCGSSATETATEAPAAEATEATEEAAPAEEVAETTTFVVGFDAEYPPYGYMNEAGEYVGFDLDLAAEVCDRLGWELVKQPIDWSAKDMELNSGAIDCIWNGFTMTGREADYTFSDPYVDNSIVFVVKADSGIVEKSDLAGMVVITQTGSSALTALTNEEDNDENLALAASFSALEQTPDYNTAFMSLESGAVDAIAVDIGVANYQLESRGDIFVMLEEELSKEQYGIGFRLGDTELRDTVQNTLNEMLADGTYDAIVAEYGLEDVICMGQ